MAQFRAKSSIIQFLEEEFLSFWEELWWTKIVTNIRLSITYQTHDKMQNLSIGVNIVTNFVDICRFPFDFRWFLVKFLWLMIKLFVRFFRGLSILISCLLVQVYNWWIWFDLCRFLSFFPIFSGLCRFLLVFCPFQTVLVIVFQI